MNAQIPPINPMDVERFEVAFNSANPVLGILDSALFIYLRWFSLLNRLYIP